MPADYVSLPAYASVPGGETYTFVEGKWTFSPTFGVLTLHASDPNDEADTPAPDEVLGEEAAEEEEVEDETGDEDTAEAGEPE